MANWFFDKDAKKIRWERTLFSTKGHQEYMVLVVQSLSHVWLSVTHGLQHSRLPCPSLSHGVCSNPCPLSQRCYPNTCQPLLLPPSIFPSIKVFSNEWALHIRWHKYWSFNFSISHSSEYSGLISFRIDWFYLLAVPGTLKSLLQDHNSTIRKHQYTS